MEAKKDLCIRSVHVKGKGLDGDGFSFETIEVLGKDGAPTFI